MTEGTTNKDKERQISQRLMIHDCHAGKFKTFARVAGGFYWRKMGCHVAKYGRICHTCAVCKLNFQVFYQMVSHPKSSHPWEVVSTNVVGPLPRSSKGNLYILVVLDYRKYISSGTRGGRDFSFVWCTSCGYLR